jgi:uncharacterized protein (DUF2147 family)
MLHALRLFLVGLCLIIAVPAMATDPVLGSWINPRGSVTVTTGACRDRLCGWVSHANAEALTDANDAGIPHLVGTTLLQDYRPKGAGHWAGRVYVPDMGRTFYSTIDQQGPDQLKISGCILGGLFCRSQLWHRVKTG